MESICEECVINILVQKEGTYLQILVQNTGSVFEDHLLDKLQDGTITPKGFGIGLLNIDKRFRPELLITVGYSDDKSEPSYRLPVDEIIERR